MDFKDAFLKKRTTVSGQEVARPNFWEVLRRSTDQTVRLFTVSSEMPRKRSLPATEVLWFHPLRGRPAFAFRDLCKGYYTLPAGSRKTMKAFINYFFSAQEAEELAFYLMLKCDTTPEMQELDLPFDSLLTMGTAEVWQSYMEEWKSSLVDLTQRGHYYLPPLCTVSPIRKSCSAASLFTKTNCRSS
jgi:hypothetical protein